MSYVNGDQRSRGEVTYTRRTGNDGWIETGSKTELEIRDEGKTGGTM